MINFFLKIKMKNYCNKTFDIKDIKNSKKVLFAIFTRYGDTIIDIAVIKEFINKYPNKKYFILCPKQMKPYFSMLLSNVKIRSFNKRNIFSFIKIIYILKKEDFDIGFNPWSNGLDSCFYITFTKKFLCYKDFQKKSLINHYDVVRKYLLLPTKEWIAYPINLNKNIKNILICPESTDIKRSLTVQETNDIINILNKYFRNAILTIASLNISYKFNNCNYFRFNKTYNSSLNFIKQIQKQDLIISVDSGPLHIATAFNKNTIAIFNTTKPNLVINTGKKIKIIQKRELVYLEKIISNIINNEKDY